MSILRDKRPSVHSLLGCRLPRKPRLFGAGILPAYEDGQVHYGSLGLPTPLPVDPPTHQASTAERDYEAACVAVAGGRAEWLTSRPSVPDRNYFDEPPTDETPDEIPVGGAYWSEELGHLESLLAHATTARRAEIERRMDGIMGMVAPRLEAERLQAESLERQLAESWALDQIEAGAERFDGRDWEEHELCRIGGGR